MYTTEIRLCFICLMYYVKYMFKFTHYSSKNNYQQVRYKIHLLIKSEEVLYIEIVMLI